MPNSQCVEICMEGPIARREADSFCEIFWVFDLRAWHPFDGENGVDALFNEVEVFCHFP